MILMIFDDEFVEASHCFGGGFFFNDFSHGYGLDITQLGLSWSGTRHIALHHPELIGLVFCSEHTGLRGYQAAS